MSGSGCGWHIHFIYLCALRVRLLQCYSALAARSIVSGMARFRKSICIYCRWEIGRVWITVLRAKSAECHTHTQTHYAFIELNAVKQMWKWFETCAISHRVENTCREIARPVHSGPIRHCFMNILINRIRTFGQPTQTFTAHTLETRTKINLRTSFSGSVHFWTQSNHTSRHDDNDRFNSTEETAWISYFSFSWVKNNKRADRLFRIIGKMDKNEWVECGADKCRALKTLRVECVR